MEKKIKMINNPLIEFQRYIDNKVRRAYMCGVSFNKTIEDIYSIIDNIIENPTYRYSIYKDRISKNMLYKILKCNAIKHIDEIYNMENKHEE